MHISKLVKTYLSSILAGLALAAFACGQPEAEHGLNYKTPAMVWDEAMPLGNGLFGALVWGDGKPLRISLDRTDLWDLRPVPEFQGKDYSYRTMRQWVKEADWRTSIVFMTILTAIPARQKFLPDVSS